MCTLFSGLLPKHYVWLLVDHDTNYVLCWHVSKYRDMGQVKVLLEKFLGNFKDKNIELITDGLGAYESALILFKNINHVVVSLGKNNQCESKFSFLKDFFQLKQGLKSLKNLDSYAYGFCILKNLWKMFTDESNRIISQPVIFITTT